MKNCSGINCPMQYGVVDAATCPTVECCPNATPPLTNADRIRAMTDEELAEFITNTDFCELLCKNYRVCEDGRCNVRLLEWLKQEAGE